MASSQPGLAPHASAGRLPRTLGADFGYPVSWCSRSVCGSCALNVRFSSHARYAVLRSTAPAARGSLTLRPWRTKRLHAQSVAGLPHPLWPSLSRACPSLRRKGNVPGRGKVWVMRCSSKVRLVSPQSHGILEAEVRFNKVSSQLSSLRLCMAVACASACPHAAPNPSLNRTRYGRWRKPGAQRLRHCRAPGLRHLPPRAGELKR